MATGKAEGPETLMSLCIVHCLRNLRGTMFCCRGSQGQLCLPPDVFLPREICNRLLSMYMELLQTDSTLETPGNFLSLFSDPRSTRLTRVQLREGLQLGDRDLQAIAKQGLVELHLASCSRLSHCSLRTLASFGPTLVSLSLFCCTNLFQRHQERVEEEEEEEGTGFSFEGFERLRVLSLGGLPEEEDVEVLLRPLTYQASLVSLDLSGARLPCASFLPHWSSTLTPGAVQCRAEPGAHQHHPADGTAPALGHLMQHPPGLHLQADRGHADSHRAGPGASGVLDISGHALLDSCPSPPQQEPPGYPSEDPSKTSIYFLQELKKPLEFLGLFDTPLCNLRYIPAHKVTGSRDEVQILNAIEAYAEFRPEIAHRAISHLFDTARIQHCYHVPRALQLVIRALKCHKNDHNIRMWGSAVLFYLTSSEYRAEQSARLRCEVIQVVLNSMDQCEEATVQRNCLLALCNFTLPQEVEFEYQRVTRLLLKILDSARQDGSAQRIAVHLCNALVCQADTHHKEAVGRMGFITTMLRLIRKKLMVKTCDQLMEFAWSALWNVTDETPDNCQMFLTKGGMKLFLDCLQAFPEKQGLHRNMLGLLGNVAEVKALRPQLLTPQFITVFSELLDSSADGIEVAYNACGVLSHVMSDGPEMWSVVDPGRDTVIDRMWRAIRRWDPNSRRNITYRSFEPIMRLLPESSAPVSQHWATWALYNLVTVYPDKYCPLLVREGGLSLLQQLLGFESSHQETKDMARRLMELCENFEDPI
ncbi:hypothetical protein AGOR_G00250820 [Albula goreensis]|uniref:Protein zer-1 homolog n=1 Tax=Albula goreensis TaxID=1534307 RepID=A0A8T3CIB6_9TELE|nr:hypothetical protein AGOR_G00250820 [Albula goreensis]